MRADFGLYVLAIICFIIAGLVILDAVPQYLPEPQTFEATSITVISAALGLIFVILGYALRPKPIISIPGPSKPVLPPSPPREETAEPEKEKPRTKTRRKSTKRRRKKT